MFHRSIALSRTEYVAIGLCVAAVMAATISMLRQHAFLVDSAHGEPIRAVLQGHPPASDEIVEVLPRDQIPALFHPHFVAADRAKIDPSAYVIGYEHGGEAHAYALNLLNGHEIINDMVGGQKIAATW